MDRKAMNLQKPGETEVRIRLEVVGWLGRAFGGTGLSRVKFEEAVESGASLGQTLRRLAQVYPEFDRVMFRGDGLTGQVEIILNGTLIAVSEVMRAPLKGGDRVILVPAYEGGR